MTFPNSGSWQCWNCKQWIPYGQSHSCPNTNYYQQTYTWPQYVDNSILERIAKALEAIAAHLTPAPPDSATVLPKIRVCPTCGTAIGIEGDEPAEPNR